MQTLQEILVHLDENKLTKSFEREFYYQRKGDNKLPTPKQLSTIKEFKKKGFFKSDISLEDSQPSPSSRTNNTGEDIFVNCVVQKCLETKTLDIERITNSNILYELRMAYRDSFVDSESSPSYEE